MTATRVGVSIFLGLAAANAAAWLWAWHLFAGHPTLLGTALLAWVFGLRHAVDADHIAAIDNVVRKLMQAGERPLTVGLYFSLGHSTVVVLACIALAGAVTVTQSGIHGLPAVGRLISTSLSAAFLLVVAAVNLGILRDVWRRFRRARQGFAPQEADLVASGGLLGRLLQPVVAAAGRGWHMFPVGFLFGLGFDTATEIGLLGISATQASQGMSPWRILVFPALFTAGMALVDTADGVLMVGAYGWAFANPLRKLWYNLTITATSVLIAVLIGGLEALGLIAGELGLQGGVWNLVSALNSGLANLGFAVVGIFALCWAASAVIYRWMRFDHQSSG